MTFLQLLYVFFKIGLLGFGGGYAMLSMIQFECVEHFGWISSQEFSDIVAISQMTPGPISINIATYVGYSVHGIFGAAISTTALCLPSMILLYFVTRFLIKNKESHYVQAVFTGLRAVLAGLIFAAALLLITPNTFCDFGWGKANFTTIIFAISFILLYFFKINPMFVLAGSGVIGLILF